MTNTEMEAKLLVWIDVLKKELITPSEPELQELLRNCRSHRYLVLSSNLTDEWADEMQRMVDSLRRKT